MSGVLVVFAVGAAVCSVAVVEEVGLEESVVKPGVEDTAGRIVRTFDRDFAQLAFPFAAGRPDRGREILDG